MTARSDQFCMHRTLSSFPVHDPDVPLIGNVSSVQTLESLLPTTITSQALSVAAEGRGRLTGLSGCQLGVGLRLSC